jgi:hypothetical protein
MLKGIAEYRTNLNFTINGVENLQRDKKQISALSGDYSDWH